MMDVYSFGKMCEYMMSEKEIISVFGSDKIVSISLDGNSIVTYNNAFYKRLNGTWVNNLYDQGLTLSEAQSGQIIQSGNYIITEIQDDAGSGLYYKVRVYVNGVGTSYNSSTKVLTLIGTRTQLNADIDTIKLTPATGYTSNFVLTYQLTSPNTASREQTVIRI
jgi:hypothetical protein